MLPDAGQPVDPRPVSARRHDCRGRQRYARHAAPRPKRGRVGFDYRLGMAVPDFWIKLLKEVPDEQWDIWQMWNMMTDRLPYVKTVAHCESHDQALVGDQTIAFRLMNKQMYTDMNRAAQNVVIDRGMALHKMIRLFTISLAGQAYLNFMGNEFRTPEWIDFRVKGTAGAMLTRGVCGVLPRTDFCVTVTWALSTGPC